MANYNQTGVPGGVSPGQLFPPGTDQQLIGGSSVAPSPVTYSTQYSPAETDLSEGELVDANGNVLGGGSSLGAPVDNPALGIASSSNDTDVFADAGTPGYGSSNFISTGSADGALDASAGDDLPVDSSLAVTQNPDASLSIPTPAAAVAATAATAAGAGTPVNITDLPSAASSVSSGVTSAGTAITAGLGSVSSALGITEAAAAATGTSWLGSIFTAGESLLVRGGLIMLGLVILIGAFVFYFVENQKGNMPPITVVA